MKSFPELRRVVNQKLAALDTARKAYGQASSAVEEAAARVEALQEAQRLAQAVAQHVQEQAHKQIAAVVTRSLAAVFDDPYEFKIIFERKRGRTEARLVFVRDGLEVDPMTACGGGVVDVAAFALRLSCLMLSRPPLRRLLVLDEPFKFLSPEYRGRLRQLIETLSKDMGVQFLLVTHMDELKIGNVVAL